MFPRGGARERASGAFAERGYAVGDVVLREAGSWGSFLWIHGDVAEGTPVCAKGALVGVVEESGKRSLVRLITDRKLVPSVRVKRGEGQHLAKGELFGTSQPIWRSRGSRLKGVGFNYDYDDALGEARDLRTGAKKGGGDLVRLIEVGDELVTTGFDGVFPSGIPVGVVSRVYPLEEGAPSYDIEADLAVGSLDDLTHVDVLQTSE